MSYRILVSDKLAEVGYEILKKAKGLEVDVHVGLPPEELKKIVMKGKYDGWIIRSATKITADLVQAANGLKIIGRAGIGVDNVDLTAASKKGVIVMNTPSGNAVTTAEHAIAMMFAISRKIPQAVASTKGGNWEKKKFMGSELSGKTLGVVGVGNIGSIVANRGLGLKMVVLGYDPFLSKEAAEKMGIDLVDLDELLKLSDYITIHTPKNEKTVNLINKEKFGKMKKGVYVINCARGGIVNEADLLEAVQNGTVAGAALDVFEKEPVDPNHPLLKEEKIIVTPHLGASTDEAQVNVAKEIAEQVVDFFTTGTVKNAVNFPSVSADVLKVIGPYLTLAEKIGSLAGQFCKSLPKEIQIEYQGEICQKNMPPLTSSLLKGLLAPMMDDVAVNYVNAPFIARDKGIKVIEAKVSADTDFANLITLIVSEGEKKRTICGTIFGNKSPRIVRIDNFYLEAVPEGTILVICNNDKPGVIGNVGTFLGENKINISRMQLGLEEGMAMALYNVEGNVTPKILGGLLKLENIISVNKVEL